jgi:phosphoribosylformylglycinamidine synthase
MRMPVAHGEGAYYADEATLDELEASGQVLFRYVRPAGHRRRRRDRATRTDRCGRSPGVMNAAGNVAGLMPHPETAVETVLGSDDGLGIIASFVASAAERERAGGLALVTAGTST